MDVFSQPPGTKGHLIATMLLEYAKSKDVTGSAGDAPYDSYVKVKKLLLDGYKSKDHPLNRWIMSTLFFWFKEKDMIMVKFDTGEFQSPLYPKIIKKCWDEYVDIYGSKISEDHISHYFIDIDEICLEKEYMELFLDYFMDRSKY